MSMERMWVNIDVRKTSLDSDLILFSLCHTHTHTDLHSCHTHQQTHRENLAAFVGVYTFIVFYSSRRVHSTFLSVICLGGAQLSVLHSFSLSPSLLPGLWVNCERVCVCSSITVCVFLSAPGWGILSCYVLSWVECSGDRTREKWEARRG